MKRIIFLLVLTLSTMTVFSQTAADSTNVETVGDAPTFKLYKTQNMWVFIKLNTQTGRMKMVQYSINDDVDRGEFDLNIINLAVGKKKINGRFTLIPTENMWNFILLDQIDGDVWQVQWSFEPRNRGVIKIE